MSGLKNTMAKIAKVDPAYKMHASLHRTFTDNDSDMGKLAGLNLLAKRKKNVNAKAANNYVRQQRAAGTLLGD